MLKSKIFNIALHSFILCIFTQHPTYSQDLNTIPELITIPEGSFIQGSSPTEREYAYQIDERAYGHSVTRKQNWYAGEHNIRKSYLPRYKISKTPITNAQFHAFIQDTEYPSPFVDQQTWQSYGLIHPYSRVKPYLWRNGSPPQGKANHPVVLITHKDARAYTDWLSRQTGQHWTLPSEAQWEKAARGTDGRRFPWGNSFNADLLNSHDSGTFATQPVGSYPSGASPYGGLDMAGQVFEWTADSQNAGRYIVKGGSWDDKGCGVCRPAARHSRPEELKHILIGFRVVQISP